MIPDTYPLRKTSRITGLDIGTSKVSAVASEIDRAGAMKVLAHATVPSRGIFRGTFCDPHEPAGTVAKALGAIRAKTGRRPANIFVNISGETVRGARSRGMIPLTVRGREVTRADMERTVDVASTVHLPYDREIIHKVVQSFSIDDQTWIRSPLGLYASRLSAEAYIVTGSVAHIQNIQKCVNDAGYDVREIVFTGIADGAALLDDEARSAGAVLLDLGASLTEVSVFAAGGLTDLDIIPSGSQDMAGDLASSDTLRAVIARVAARIKAADHSPRQVVLTGGFAFADGIVEALEAGLGRPVRVGAVKGVGGDLSSLDALRLTTAIGLCRYAYEKFEKKAREDRDVVKRLTTKVVDLFNSYF